MFVTDLFVFLDLVEHVAPCRVLSVPASPWCGLRSVHVLVLVLVPVPVLGLVRVRVRVRASLCFVYVCGGRAVERLWAPRQRHWHGHVCTVAATPWGHGTCILWRSGRRVV